MKAIITLLIQKTFEYKNADDYEKKLNKIIDKLEKEGWNVNIEAIEDIE